jgi:nicotinamide-nucleotide amidase
MRVEILCTGDEILTGKTINTNYSHMARRLGEVGLDVHWGTTVGDDRATLLAAFKQAGDRADAVIVNGGLGPTVDDLSQELAAEACGVPLVLHEPWLQRMTESYARRGRVMPANNRKQAMLPANAEFIDNPVGTACGFAVTIGKARFLFTPGVPREMRLMLDEQVIPRLLKMSGVASVVRLKRFHSFGIGESRADEMLAGIPGLAIDGDIKLGFQAHFPQLETKLAIRGADETDLNRRLAPVEAEVRKRLGNFVVAEDSQSLEGVVLEALKTARKTLAIGETVTGGIVAARVAPLPGAESVFKQGVIGQTVSVDALRKESGADIALTVDVKIDTEGGAVIIGIADGKQTIKREARLVGNRDWVRTGACELGLDCLRRHLLDLPVDERIDFERR